MSKAKFDWAAIGGRPEKTETESKKFDWKSIGGRPDIDEDNQDDPEETKGWSGIGQDIAHKGWESIKGLPHALMQLPGEVYGVGKQLGEPSRIAKNLGAGFGHLGHNILSGPGNLRDYLVQKELMGKESPSYRLPEEIIPKEFNYGKGVGLEGHQAGDELIQGMPTGMALGPLADIVPKIPGLRSGKRHQEALSKALEENEMKTQSHAQTLGQGQEHGAHVSQGLLNDIEGIVNPETGKREGGLRREIGSKYEKLSEDLSNEQVKIENTPDLKVIQKEIAKLGKGIKSSDKENLFKVLVAQDSKLKTVNGADALTAYRELKRQKNKAYQSAYEPGIGPKEHSEWITKAEQINGIETKMKEMLEKQIGPKYLDRLKSIDKEWSKQIAPLSENSMYQEMVKHGQTSKNIMKYLNGKTRGNETLNALVEKNPEYQTKIVGQRFAEKPEKMAEQSELLEKYARMNPKIAKIIEEQKAIKHFEKNDKAALEEAVKKARERKLGRRGFVKGVAATGLGGAAAIAGETALGRDWKKDIPVLAALLSLKKHRK